MNESDKNRFLYLDKIAEREPVGPGIQVRFLWESEPSTFGGLTQEQLRAYIQKAADFYRIRPADQTHISFDFSDHSSLVYPDKRKRLSTVHTVPGYSKNQTVDATILFNRSLEVFEIDNQAHLQANTEDGKDIEVTQSGIIGLTLVYPWEAIVWRIAEEINHAAVVFRIGNRLGISKAISKYEQYTSKFHQGKETIADYTKNIIEVTAARRTLKFLIMVAQELAPERVAIYQEALRLSQELRMVVLPDEKLVAKDVYINTGYQPT